MIGTVQLTNMLVSYVYGIFNAEITDDLVVSAQAVVNSLQVLEVITPTLHHSLRPHFLSLFPLLLSCICSPFTAVRHMAARCVATYTLVDLHHSMMVRF